jgi:hypothetical protein
MNWSITTCAPFTKSPNWEHQAGELLLGEARHSLAIPPTPLQQLPASVRTLDETELPPDDDQARVTALTAIAGRPLTPEEILELSPRARLGQPGRSVVPPNVAEQVCTLLSLGFSKRQTAAYLGISASAIYKNCARDPEFAADVQQALDMRHMRPELTIIAEAQKNWRAAAWYLQYKKQNPPPLTEEEKEEQHQARMAARRREAEYGKQLMRDAAAEIQAFREEEERGQTRTPPPDFETAMRSIGLVREKKVRTKKVRGK